MAKSYIVKKNRRGNIFCKAMLPDGTVHNAHIPVGASYHSAQKGSGKSCPRCMECAKRLNLILEFMTYYWFWFRKRHSSFNLDKNFCPLIKGVSNQRTCALNIKCPIKLLFKKFFPDETTNACFININIAEDINPKLFPAVMNNSSESALIAFIMQYNNFPENILKYLYEISKLGYKVQFLGYLEL